VPGAVDLGPPRPRLPLSGPLRGRMAALGRLAVQAYCLRRPALPCARARARTTVRAQGGVGAPCRTGVLSSAPRLALRPRKGPDDRAGAWRRWGALPYRRTVFGAPPCPAPAQVPGRRGGQGPTWRAPAWPARGRGW